MRNGSKRTTKGLRDVLFDEIDQLRHGDGDPQRAMAVANLAKQIINIAKVELDFHRENARLQEKGTVLELGNMQLGSTRASAAETSATGQSDRTTDGTAALLPS